MTRSMQPPPAGRTLPLALLMAALAASTVITLAPARPAMAQASWQHLLTETGDLDPPNTGSQQTASLVLDVDLDGLNDFFIAERTRAPSVVWYRRGASGWTRHVIDNTQLRIEAGGAFADIDGEGDIDILGKPYNWDTPHLDIWLQNGTGLALDAWQRHVIDDARPWRALFITAEDLDGDGRKEIITGAWWYANAGTPAGDWTRHTIGSPLRNMAAVHDFDGDGHADILGTKGQGSASNDHFVWARGDGAGGFTILSNIPDGDGDFLQGVAVEGFTDGGPTEVALSWHAAGKGVQTLTSRSACWRGCRRIGHGYWGGYRGHPRSRRAVSRRHATASRPRPQRDRHRFGHARRSPVPG